MMDKPTCRQALEVLYGCAHHHSRCVRGDVPHHCSCGVSAAIHLARLALGKPDPYLKAVPPNK